MQQTIQRASSFQVRTASLFGVVTVALVAACVAQKPENPVSGKGFVLLTRQGCANTPTMRARLDDALTALQLPGEYDVVDIGSLPKGDVRRGYPTPTLLYEGVDVFGLPTPPSPPPGPAWRIYPGGVPSVAAIREQVEATLARP